MQTGEAKPLARSEPPSYPPLWVQVHAPSENFLLLSFATGISAEGVSVRASRSLPLGTKVRLDIRCNGDEEHVVAFGTVVRVRDEPGNRGMDMSFEATRGPADPRLAKLIGRLR